MTELSFPTPPRKAETAMMEKCNSPMKWVESTFLAILVLVCLGSPLFAAEPVHCLETTIHMPLVTGKVGDVDLVFLIDSGSCTNVICSSVLGTITHSEPEFYDGNTGVQVIDAIDVTVGSYRNALDAPTAILDLTPISESCQIQCDGILGMPFLADKSLVFASHGVYLTSERQKKEASDIELDCDSDEFGRLFVDLESPGEVTSEIFHTLIDTGMNSDLTIQTASFDSLIANGRLFPNAITDAAFVFDEDCITLQTRRTGTVLWRLFGPCASVPMDVSTDNKNKMGTTLLRQLGARIDFKSKILFLRLPGSGLQGSSK